MPGPARILDPALVRTEIANAHENFFKANLNRSAIDLSQKLYLNVNARMRTEIDLNEYEHFFKANMNRSEIDPIWITCIIELDRSEFDLSQKRSECERWNAN